MATDRDVPERAPNFYLVRFTLADDVLWEEAYDTLPLAIDEANAAVRGWWANPPVPGTPCVRVYPAWLGPELEHPLPASGTVH